jgi:hypothetical protein
VIVGWIVSSVHVKVYKVCCIDQDVCLDSVLLQELCHGVAPQTFLSSPFEWLVFSDPTMTIVVLCVWLGARPVIQSGGF